MKNKFIIYFTFSAIVFLFLAFNLVSKKVYWHKRNLLKWNDFTVVDNLKGDEGARITSGFEMISSKKINKKKGGLELTIKSYMIKRESYVEKKLLRDSLLLKHEQGHFDISEIFARKLRKVLNDTILFEKHLNLSISRIYNRLSAEGDKYQDLYDKETNHSRNTVMQKQWEIKIAKQLEELNQYKDVKVVCKVIKKQRSAP